jgi:RNA polymerase sigma-70 factor (ECF subfamily)
VPAGRFDRVTDPETPETRDELLRRQMVGLLPRLRRFARSLAKDPSRADDLVQAACERALGRLGQMQENTRLDSWLFRIVYTQWVDRLRRRRTRQAHLKIVSGQYRLPQDPAELSGGRMAAALDLSKALGCLPEDYRAAMMLVCVEGYTYAEAAQVLDVPSGTVASRVARARETLARMLRADAAKVVALSGRSLTEGRK